MALTSCIREQEMCMHGNNPQNKDLCTQQSQLGGNVQKQTLQKCTEII